jgi:hypothetical protein
MFLRSFLHLRPHTSRITPIVGVCMLIGCASSSNAIERLKDGSYRLECRSTLANCLLQAEKPCAAYGYEVLSGREETRVFGPEQVQSKHVNSEAIVMCRNADGWFDDRPQPARTAKASDAPQPPPPAQRGPNLLTRWPCLSALRLRRGHSTARAAQHSSIALHKSVVSWRHARLNDDRTSP